MTWLTRFNLVTWLVGLGILVLTYLDDPLSFYLLITVALVAIGILGLNPDIEHAGTDVGHGHAHLANEGYPDEGKGRHVTRGFFRTYRHAFHASPYPGTAAPDDTFGVVGTSLASSDE